MFMLHDLEGNVKRCFMATKNSPHYILTDRAFYQFDVAESKQLQELIENPHAKSIHLSVENFRGEKDIKIQLCDAKFFFKIYLFLNVSHFFIDGLPKYEKNAYDLPQGCKYLRLDLLSYPTFR